jgi:hypothetical protein
MRNTQHTNPEVRNTSQNCNCILHITIVYNITKKHILFAGTPATQHHHAATHYFKDFNIATSGLFLYILSTTLS